MEDLERGLPRASLDRALAVPGAILKAGRPLTRVRIAAAMGLRPGTGSANTRTIAAKKFSLIRPHPEGGYEVTDLGRRLVEDSLNVDLRRTAILGVEAFRRLVDLLGVGAPRASRDELAGAIAGLGVPFPRAEEAARVFDRSWPSNDDVEPVRAAVPVWDEPPSVSQVMVIDPQHHPVLATILAQLPPTGERWDPSDRDAWLEMLASAVKFVFPSGDGGLSGRP